MMSEELRKYKHDWYVSHKEECLQRADLWHKTHPEAFKGALLRYRKTHQQEFNRRQKEYYRRHKEELLEKDKIRRELEPEKAHAHNVARYIPLAPNCELCPSTERLQRHHPDYSEPYIVVTLCKDCHEVQDNDLFDAGITNISAWGKK
jgi:hypothetical protein